VLSACPEDPDPDPDPDPSPHSASANARANGRGTGGDSPLLGLSVAGAQCALQLRTCGRLACSAGFASVRVLDLRVGTPPSPAPHPPLAALLCAEEAESGSDSVEQPPFETAPRGSASREEPGESKRGCSPELQHWAPAWMRVGHPASDDAGDIPIPVLASGLAKCSVRLRAVRLPPYPPSSQTSPSRRALAGLLRPALLQVRTPRASPLWATAAGPQQVDTELRLFVRGAALAVDPARLDLLAAAILALQQQLAVSSRPRTAAAPAPDATAGSGAGSPPAAHARVLIGAGALRVALLVRGRPLGRVRVSALDACAELGPHTAVSTSLGALELLDLSPAGVKHPAMVQCAPPGEPAAGKPRGEAGAEDDPNYTIKRGWSWGGGARLRRPPRVATLLGGLRSPSDQRLDPSAC
jgi:hypothetical protein